eukprot:309662-Chlamydomonas_euryale.AAC.2
MFTSPAVLFHISARHVHFACPRPPTKILSTSVPTRSHPPHPPTQILGTYDPATLESLHTLASICYSEGKMQEAEMHAGKVYDGRWKLSGWDNLQTQDSQMLYAKVRVPGVWSGWAISGFVCTLQRALECNVCVLAWHVLVSVLCNAGWRVEGGWEREQVRDGGTEGRRD